MSAVPGSWPVRGRHAGATSASWVVRPLHCWVHTRALFPCPAWGRAAGGLHRASGLCFFCGRTRVRILKFGFLPPEGCVSAWACDCPSLGRFMACRSGPAGGGMLCASVCPGRALVLLGARPGTLQRVSYTPSCSWEVTVVVWGQSKKNWGEFPSWLSG